MTYQLKRVKAPKLKGLALRAFTGLMESRLSRPLLLPGLLKNSGMNEFRELQPTAVPTMYPRGAAASGAQAPIEGTALADKTAKGATQPATQCFQHPSIIDYARAYRNGAASPNAVARRIIDAVEHSNQLTPPLRAIIKSDNEDVLQQAKDSTTRIAAGTARSILEGVPVAIKDELDLLPYTTNVGTRFLGQQPATEDATAAGRLRAAGALLIGKANMYEIGIAPMGNNPINGFCRNPYHVQHDSGGSSSGCGASVGAGIVPLAIGADGGGSIRVPASLCGVVGLKATFGRISEFGAASLCWSVGHVGPLGATALDTAIGYALCAGADSRDRLTTNQPPVELNHFHKTDLSGIKLGVYEPWFQDADPDVVKQCEATMQVLENAGAVRKSVDIPGLEESRLAHAVTILTEMAAAMEPFYDKHRTDFAHPTRINLVLAREFTNIDYIKAQRIRTEALAVWDRILSEVDVVMTPSVACTVPKLAPGSESYGESDLFTVTSLMHYVIPGNFCGLPAISFPAGYDQRGLPVGIQAIGRHWDEQLLLQIANTVEQFTERRQPSVCYNPLTG
jgi:Asp-tRNA(Asn)/Glu-tRNA(Gln) amidotransferase A subunit family amidase